MSKLIITQSNYIPWKGYFDAIALADKVILFDDMQYTKRDWRNRNKIKTKNGVIWLTIPVAVKGKFFQKINETKVVGHEWRKSHWSSIEHSYRKSAFFDEFSLHFKQIYEDESKVSLSEINLQFILMIMSVLGINTPIQWSHEFELRGDRSERILNLCKDVCATDYYSGPAAKAYLDLDIFENAGIKVNWLDYSNYPEYRQLYGKFEHYLSILDLIFNEGPNANRFMKNVKKNIHEL